MSDSDLLQGTLAYLSLVPFVAWFAKSRMHRSFGTWFLMSFVVTPLVAMVFLMLLGPQKKEEKPSVPAPKPPEPGER